LNYFYILITSPRTHCRIISFIKKLNVIFLLEIYSEKKLLMLMALFYDCKMVKFHPKKNPHLHYYYLFYIIKKMDKGYDDLKDLA
jgi:hypothetical protein